MACASDGVGCRGGGRRDRGGCGRPRLGSRGRGAHASSPAAHPYQGSVRVYLRPTLTPSAARCSRQRLSGDRTESPPAGHQQRRRRRGLGGQARSHESSSGRRLIADATGLACSHATMSEALSQNSSRGSRLAARRTREDPSFAESGAPDRPGRGRTRSTPMATARPGRSCQRGYHAPALQAPCQRKNAWRDDGAYARCGNTGSVLRDQIKRSYGPVVGGAATRTYWEVTARKRCVRFEDAGDAGQRLPVARCRPTTRRASARARPPGQSPRSRPRQ